MAFHVPEESRLTKKDHPILGTDAAVGPNGCFLLASPEPGWALWIIASGTDDPAVPEAAGWEHVSVHAFQGAKMRMPSWREMCFIKDTFWDGEDLVVQYHPRRSQYVNCHPATLHLWRSRTQPFPEPDPSLVGPGR